VKKEETERLEIRIKKSLKAKLKKAADSNNRSMANYIISLLEQSINNKNKNV